MHRHNEHLDDLKSPAQTQQAMESAATEKEYACPMHPEIRHRGPGTCPKCGMPLEPVLPELEQAILNSPTFPGASGGPCR